LVRKSHLRSNITLGREEIYGVQGRLYEKEKEIEILRRRDAMNTDAISALSDKLAYVVKLIIKL
jgi:hypothetical protein